MASRWDVRVYIFILSFLSEVLEAVDNHKYYDIHLDYGAALDKVPHETLIKKFEASSVGEEIFNRIQAWLMERE